jgi:Bacterial Ig-like domain (group 2)
MKSKLISYAIAVGIAVGITYSVSAQDSHWNGTVGNNDWNNPNNWNPVGVPPPGNPITTFTGNVWLDPSPVDGDKTITIGPGEFETPGVTNSSEVFNTIFGPEFGCDLEVYGTLTYDWTVAMYQPDPTPGQRSIMNIRGNGYVYTSGASLNLGSGWWNVCEGTYCTLNIYDNGNFSSLAGAGLWSGGHINIYDNGSFLANTYVNLNNGQANNDGTTYFNVGGGTLKLPEGFMTSTVTNWIQRGILRPYGKGYDMVDWNISDNGTNTIVTALPLGGVLQQVSFLPLATNSLQAGDFEQVTLVGNYPSVSGVVLSSSEPGIDPANFPRPAYSSSNPSVATIDTNGLLTCVSPGTSTITATVGALHTASGVMITVTPAGGTLIHRYSFTTDASDSVGGANGTLNGDASVSSGHLVLTGNQGSSVILPPGILSGIDEVTIETWVTFPATINAFANLCAFGFSDNIPLDPNNGAGGNYITFSPHTGGGTAQANFGQGIPGNLGERDAVLPGTVFDNMSNMQIAIVFHPKAGYEAFYTNGVLCAQISMYNNMIDPVAYEDSVFTNKSILSYTLGLDTTNFIGQSLYTADPGLLANVDEFRIYNGALSQSQIQADFAAGPNALPSQPITIVQSGNNVIISWPVAGTSGLNLMESAKIGPGASWSAVGGTTNIVAGVIQESVPIAGTTEFFRLSN